MRAAPPTSGIEANSTTRTGMTPSVVGIRAGYGSVGVWASAVYASASDAAIRQVGRERIMNMGSYTVSALGAPTLYKPQRHGVTEKIRKLCVSVTLACWSD